MNDALARKMDLLAMATSVVLAVLFTFLYHRKAKGRLRAFPLFLMIFGPMAIAVHMAFHLMGVGYVASLKIGAGTFPYDFRFYALLLMAGVLGFLSFQLLHQSTSYFISGRIGKKRWLATCGLIVLVAAPTIPFTFIGSLPVQAVIINLIASVFIRKRRNKKAPAGETQSLNFSEAPQAATV